MKSSDISVIVPLYNKAAEIERALLSVVSQRAVPCETLVVDDGSTDGGGDIAERFAAAHPEANIRVIRQPNGGVSAARNRAIAEAKGEYAALLDADDCWTPEHLSDLADLSERYPDCTLYASSFSVNDGRRTVAGDTPQCVGRVDFFAVSLRGYAVIPSSAVLRREDAIAAGGFPEGMRMGEDQYLWVKLARRGAVALSPARTAIYSKAASNRSAAIYRPEECRFSFEDLLAGASGDAEREYIARAALGKALTASAKGGTDEARRALTVFGYTRHNRRAWLKLRAVNALPVSWRQPLLNIYNTLAWVLARKGL